MNDAQTYPDVQRILAKRQELIRRCAARVIDDHQDGLRDDPEALKWARFEAGRIKPLDGPLSDGIARPRISTDEPDEGKTNART